MNPYDDGGWKSDLDAIMEAFRRDVSFWGEKGETVLDAIGEATNNNLDNFKKLFCDGNDKDILSCFYDAKNEFRKTMKEKYSSHPDWDDQGFKQ